MRSKSSAVGFIVVVGLAEGPEATIGRLIGEHYFLPVVLCPMNVGFGEFKPSSSLISVEIRLLGLRVRPHALLRYVLSDRADVNLLSFCRLRESLPILICFQVAYVIMVRQSPSCLGRDRLWSSWVWWRNVFIVFVFGLSTEDLEMLSDRVTFLIDFFPYAPVQA